MTTETRKRIRAYKKALPELRERVIAVALLLAMSASMLASASFAWITLSAAPELTGMQTTVAANGNLEIALAQGSISEPAVAPLESLVGDSSAAEGQTIVGANVTWGNLVNVSDPTYGLSKIALRPALLSDHNRTEYPLNGATYGGDGRVVVTNDRYEFASYEKQAGSDEYYFAAGADKSGNSLVNYGVRAITSVTYVNFSGNNRVTKYYDDTNNLYIAAQEYYGKIVANEKNEVNTLDEAANVTCISALEGLVTVFAQDKINKMGHGPDGDAGVNTKTSCSPYLWYIYQMMLRLEKVLTDEGIALLELVNWQAYIKSGDDKIEKKVATVDQLLGMTETQWRDDLGLTESTIKTIKSYKSDLNDLNFCINGGTRNGKTYSGIKPMAEKCSNPNKPEVDYYWGDIEVYINVLVNIDTATLAGKTLSSISGIDDALAIIGGGDVIVYGGVLRNIEARLVNQQNRVKANVEVSVYTDIFIAKNPTIPGVVYTDVGKKGTEPTYAQAFTEASKLVTTAKGEATAKDTYGLAIDLWVRTNYPNAVLTLEGSAVYEDRRATITVEGTEYELYTITVGDEDAKMDVDIYKNGDKWYYASNNSEVTEENITPAEKYIPVVVGYEGENRVWEDWRQLLADGFIEQDATTQGAGSCFVFYANTPTEQAKIKEMLRAFNVAFINQNGDILGTAQLNLDSAYENQGKVTVPLEVITGADYTDDAGKAHKGITTLVQNEPTMITAIVYLNGSMLHNENVLAEGELQGQLNIQFGTDSTLIAPDNEALQQEARTIVAEVTVDGKTIKDGTIGVSDESPDGLVYKPEGYDATVKLTIDGDQPERISGFFVRVINSTQGARGEEVRFEQNDDGTWTANFKLTNPGLYVFDTLLVDGVQYTLHDGTEQSGMGPKYEPNRPKVLIKGLKITSATVGVPVGTYMTADSSKEFPVTVKVDSAMEVKQVNAQFFNDDNTKQYTAILTYDDNNDQWVGSANISSSDTYTLKYISVDGNTFDAPPSGSYTLYLGLKASVYTTLAPENWEFNYTGPSQIGMQVAVFDDEGNPITNLEGLQLYYNNVASPAGLTWKDKVYEGVFDIVQPGELTFQKLELGDLGTIRSSSNAPRFLAISMETPSYGNGQTPSTQMVIADDKTATMTVVLKDAGTAQNVYAEIWREGDSTPLYLPANETSGDVRSFTIDPKLDGVYTLKKVFLQGVYDKEWVNAAGEKEGKWYANTKTAPASGTDSTFMILEATDNPTTEVFATYNVNVYYDGDLKGSYNSTQPKNVAINVNLTPEAGAFLQEHTTGNISVVITDYRGNPVNIVSASDSLLQIQHDSSTTERYGGYEITAGTKNQKIDFAATASGNTITFAGVKLKQAGEYNTTEFKVNIGGSVVVIKSTPKFTISSVEPTATITAISPTGSNATRITYTTKSLSLGRGTQPTFTAGTPLPSSFDQKTNTATVYAVATADNDTQRHGSFTRPTLTMTVAGVDSGCAVSLTLPGGSADAIVFSRTGNGTIPKTLGKVSQIKSWKTNYGLYTHTLDAYYGHGEQTITDMTIVKDNTTYTVTLDQPIVINNPSSVNQS